MRRKGEFLFLGSGGSMGVPVVGCMCPVCTSNSDYNKRLRPSGIVEMDGKKLLIDSGPDFRYQALRAHIHHIDGVLLTHTHYDHVGGLDDLRIFFFRQQEALPCLLSEVSYEDLRKRYDYLFKEKSHGSNVTAQLKFQILDSSRGHTTFQGIKLGYFSYKQGHMLVNGFRFGDFAYVSDISIYPETIFEDLKGIKTLVVSALRHTPAHVHFTVEQAVAFAKRTGAEQTYFTHISHELDHEETNALLPSGIHMGYDGLRFTFAPE